MNTATSLVAPRMQSLQKLEKALKRLDLSWKVIETTARVVSPAGAGGFIATLEHTRSAFSRLAAEMVEQIAQTHWTNCRHDLEARAQVAIDILVRNLFERTADVGFIATDGPLVQFAQNPHPHAAAALHNRLTEYRNKYTVYDDILVLGPDAQVLLSLQGGSGRADGAPAWWSHALHHSGYVESYGPSPLFAVPKNVLLYAHRIAPEGAAVCGAVVLKFDLDSELQSIFQALERPGIVIALLDAQARVVASSDPARLAAGQSLEVPNTGAAAQAPQTLCIGGADYVYAHCHTRGYQGYGGPGWTALALLPLEEAFSGANLANIASGGSAKAKPEAPQEAIDIALDNAALQAIIARARAIELDLNRVIWNGKLQDAGTGSGSALGPVFAEIGRASAQTISAFDGAIRELKFLHLSGRRAELAAHATLAVDIMDRNLYERANDCRWWALSEEFAHILQTLDSASSSPDDEQAAQARERAAALLAHLNNLYTVYRRVALFDRNGRIVAVSRDPQSLAPDAHIATALLQNTLSLQSSQAYAVSDMQPHALADGEATYLYCAPIRKPVNTTGTDSAAGRPLGGIALAFNCASELQAMLQDALPPGASALGLLLDDAGRVLSSTDPRIAVGDMPDFLNAGFCQWQGHAYLTGQAQSKGYREFKTTDGYRCNVRSVLLAPVETGSAAHTGFSLPRPALAAGTEAMQFGVVQCGRMLFALSSLHVVEAVATTHLGAPVADSDADGLLRYKHHNRVLVLPAYDGCKLTGQPPMAEPAKAVAVVLRAGESFIAVLVERLVDVVECASVAAPPGGINPDAPWISGFLHDNRAESEPVFTLDPGGFRPLTTVPSEVTKATAMEAG